MSVWDLSDREAWGQLEQRAAGDAWQAIRDLWPLAIPQDLAGYANERTQDFLQESISLPRRAFGNQEQMQFVYREIGNCYYWTFLRVFTDAVAERIRTTRRVPMPTTPPIPMQRERHDSSGKGA